MKKIPVTPVIVVAIFVALGVFVFLFANKSSGSFEKMSSRELALVCLSSEGQVMHIHPHLSLIAEKKLVTIPVDIGIDHVLDCIHALHTHDATGVLHVESPAKKDFTLGDFFAVWGKTLNASQILDYKVDANHGLKFYVDGKESTDFGNLLLKDHQDIVVDYYALKDGPDPLPKPYDWNGFETPAM